MDRFTDKLQGNFDDGNDYKFTQQIQLHRTM